MKRKIYFIKMSAKVGTGNRGEGMQSWAKAARILHHQSVKDRNPGGEMRSDPVCSDWMTDDTLFRSAYNNPIQDRHGNYT